MAVLAIVMALLLPIVFSHRRGHQRFNRLLTLIANAVITVAMIPSLIFLSRVCQLTAKHQEHVACSGLVGGDECPSIPIVVLEIRSRRSDEHDRHVDFE